MGFIEPPLELFSLERKAAWLPGGLSVFANEKVRSESSLQRCGAQLQELWGCTRMMRSSPGFPVTLVCWLPSRFIRSTYIRCFNRNLDGGQRFQRIGPDQWQGAGAGASEGVVLTNVLAMPANCDQFDNQH